MDPFNISKLVFLERRGKKEKTLHFGWCLLMADMLIQMQ